MRRREPEADICLILEGAYPFIAGGVSSWVHDLIKSQPQFTFHIVALSADDLVKELRFELPPNVIRMTEIALQQSERRVAGGWAVERLIAEMEEPLTRLFRSGGLADFRQLVAALRRRPRAATRAALMNSEAAFGILRRMYEGSVSGSSFLKYFWSWRSLAGGLFSVLLAELPRARVYHTISTGYAGLMMARAVLADRPPWPAYRTRHLYQRAACGNRHGPLVGRQDSRVARHRGPAPRSPRRVDRSVHRLFAHLLRGV